MIICDCWSNRTTVCHTGDLSRCVLIVNNLFQSVRCVATPSNVIDQRMWIGKLGITV